MYVYIHIYVYVYNGSGGPTAYPSQCRRLDHPVFSPFLRRTFNRTIYRVLGQGALLGSARLPHEIVNLGDASAGGVQDTQRFERLQHDSSHFRVQGAGFRVQDSEFSPVFAQDSFATYM